MAAESLPQHPQASAHRGGVAGVQAPHASAQGQDLPRSCHHFVPALLAVRTAARQVGQVPAGLSRQLTAAGRPAALPDHRQLVAPS